MVFQFRFLILTTAIFLLSWQLLFAAGSSNAGDFIDENGVWQTNINDEIRSEAGFFLQYYRIKADVLAINYEPEEINFNKVTFDTLNLGIGYKYYLKPRYQNSSVPFSFIPYNYRNNYFSFFYLPSRNSQKSNSSDISNNTTNFLLDILYHIPAKKTGFFIGNSTRYHEEYSKKRYDLNLQTGFYSCKGKYGLRTNVYNFSEESRYSQGHAILTISPFMEQMISPYAVIKGAFEYTYARDIDWKKYGFPVFFGYIFTDSWMELNLSIKYAKISTKDKFDNYYYDIHHVKDIDGNEFDCKFTLKKYFDAYTLYISPRYFRVTDDYLLLSQKFYEVTIGGDYNFNRKIFLEAFFNYRHYTDPPYNGVDSFDKIGLGFSASYNF